ncbi:nucleotidyl transferase AbiEii/AbiGii toxin family protein [Cryomorpha ignava]|uniref:Nucleotidyl transferase AbiEii/AbiGii toxin family protein n=1 Tax=Cryomorpha ignava TaxID=101383 RepID=A0A7K3WPG1_9FLAO|nr:nucleotidyl transferase AbiEii/AbiGii toxin family protein [Cryomorpha ignava]NEN23527.1 nucleotidyl transferase AbiEii/AbiGii toxin family protein [Cryomorpha ignava]
MLHYTTIHPETLQLLKRLQEIDYLSNFRLVGGTALALQIGHRLSVDLDLFAFSELEVAPILDQIDSLGKIKIINHSPKVLNILIDDIKVDFVTYQYDFLRPVEVVDNIRLASIEDIAAMKLSAITSRGAKKDFIDLFFLLKTLSLAQMFEYYYSKFPDGSDFLVAKSLTYFNDADIEPMPKMLKPVTWNDVKNRIIQEVDGYFS